LETAPAVAARDWSQDIRNQDHAALAPVIAWALGAVGAVFMSKLLAREWRRVNAELDAQRRTAEEMRPQEIPTLRRDASGVYRPE
jgi:hypothetical protein